MKNFLFILSIIILNAKSCESKKNSIPECIQEKIEAIASKDVSNPPTKIYQYIYNKETVFFITSKCCDIPSIIYDKECNKICSPSGGFTGKGDGMCSDFFENRTEEKLIWEDERKYISKKRN